MSVIHAPRQPELDARYTVILGVCALGLATIFLRLWYIQVVRAEDLANRADRSRRSSVEKMAPRGLIFDRNQNLVAGVRSQSVVTAIPKIVNEKPEVLPKLAAMLGADPKKLEAKLKDGNFRPYLPTPIYADVPIELASRIAESEEDELPGIDVETQPMRYYPNTADLAHILGYVWTPSDKDLRRITESLEGSNLKPAAYVGKIGIERVFETALMGKPGSDSLEVDAKRRPVRVAGRVQATPGQALTLTIDRDLQKYANAVLGDWIKRKPDAGGAIVAIEPSTGEILALSSAPTYDASKFVGGISQADYQGLLEDPRKPLLNRAIAGTYSPGSTFKIVTALAAQQAGLFDTNRTALCRGYYEMGRQKLRCTGTHGSVSFHRAFQQSCNAYFADLGVRVGREKLLETIRAMGIGSVTGLDLVGEASGGLGLRTIEERVAKDEWYRGNQAQISIGQGDMIATPLQMACIVSMVANKGVMYRPHLVRALRGDNDTNKLVDPEEIHRLNVDAFFWTQLDSAMVDVIDRGTGKRAQISGLTWAGKTGSTEHGRKTESTHSWFVGFAPADNPKIAIAVLAEKAGHGGDVAAPIAAAVVKHYLESRAKASEKTGR